jgi:hypothetical protein
MLLEDAAVPGVGRLPGHEPSTVLQGRRVHALLVARRGNVHEAFGAYGRPVRRKALLQDAGAIAVSLAGRPSDDPAAVRKSCYARSKLIAGGRRVDPRFATCPVDRHPAASPNCLAKA